MGISPDVAPESVSQSPTEQALVRQVEFSQLAVEHMGAGLVVCDCSGLIVLCNALARSWTHEGCRELLDALSPANPASLETGSGEHPGNEESPLARALRGETVANLEFVIPAWAKIPARHLLASVTPLSSSEGNRKGAVLVMHDISARIQSENALLLAKQQAAKASDAKGNFLSAMSHELRTPLNAILGFAQLMKREAALSDEHRSHLDLINSCGEHLLSVINQSLDMSKVEAGEFSVDLTPVAVDTAVQDIAAILRPRATEKNLTLNVTCDWTGTVRTDAGKLRQVLFNLVGNAIKFTSHGEVSIRLGLLASQKGGESRLIFNVEDTGPGIAPADLTRVFEPFFRAAADCAQQGTGLGLTITRQHVELMGGVITATSKLGAGSCFRVELPVGVVDHIASGRAKPAPLQGELLADGQAPCRVLIVEDHRTNANLLRRILENAGFLARVAENGASAIETFTSWHPHFIWMDVMMNGMDGAETTRAIRALPEGKNVKIVALSACSFNSQGAAMMAAGCDDYLTKPSPAKAIVACVARLLKMELISEAARTAPASASPVHPPSKVRELPENFKSDLRTAVLSLNAKEIAVAIERIRPLAPEMAQQLMLQAQQLNYTAMLGAISAVGV